MKIFLKHIFIFLIIFILTFSSIISLNYYLIHSEKFVINSNRHILILGDSNSQCAINDSIFKSSYNVSGSADSYFYSYLKLKKILISNQNIDTVLLSFSPHNIFDNGWLFSNDHMYSNFCKYYPLMMLDDLKVLLYGNPEGLFSSLPAISKQLVYNIIAKVRYGSIFSLYGGFWYLDRNILAEVLEKLKNDEPIPFFKIPNNFSVAESEELYLDKIISVCESKGIKLYFINLPKRKEILTFPKYGVKEFNEFYDRKYKLIDFLDFSIMNLPDDDYGDLVHLNIRGSTFFSLWLEKEGIVQMSKEYKRK